MFSWLGRIKTIAIEAVAVLLAILAAWAVGMRKGEKAADNANAAAAAKATTAAITKTNTASQRVDALPTEQVQQELHDKWSRD